MNTDEVVLPGMADGLRGLFAGEDPERSMSSHEAELSKSVDKLAIEAERIREGSYRVQVYEVVKMAKVRIEADTVEDALRMAMDRAKDRSLAFIHNPDTRYWAGIAPPKKEEETSA